MKRMFLAGCVFCGMLSAADRVEDAYDLFSPTPNNWDRIDITVDGDKANSRVSLKMGKNPMKVKDEKGKLMEPDPKFKTEYVVLRNYGAEDNRAFRLHANPQVGKDEWKKLVFSFVPRRDGKVEIKIGRQGQHWYDKESKTWGRYPDLWYTFYTKAEAKNTTLKDPNFTNAKAWRSQPFIEPFRSLKAEYITEENAPTARVLKSIGWMYQVLPVKKDKEVVISFYVRGGDFFKCKLVKEEDEK